MSTFRTKQADFNVVEVDGIKKLYLLPAVFDAFDVSLLGLGDVKKKSRATDAIAAVFDLQGFTSFCGQIEPHLSVPLFLNRFLEWLFSKLKEEVTQEKSAAGVLLWCPLPFFVKFLGDGLLVLWDSSSMGNVTKRNVILSARQICTKYKTDFLPSIRGKVVGPPPILRCGLACGSVYSVGDGNDFVGSCINMAARLQKLPSLTFAFNRRGFDLEDEKAAPFFKNRIVVRKVSIRGIGDGELIAILKDELNQMKRSESRMYREP